MESICSNVVNESNQSSELNEGSEFLVRKFKYTYETLIKDLGFSSHAYNCLDRSGIKTLGHIKKLEFDDLVKIRSLGEKSVKEIIDCLMFIEKYTKNEECCLTFTSCLKFTEVTTLTSQTHIRHLKLPNRAYNALIYNGVNTIGKLKELSLEDILKKRLIGESTAKPIISVLESLEIDKITENDAIEFLDVKTEYTYETPISDLNLSACAFNCLNRSNIINLGDLKNKSKKDLLKIRGLETKILNEIIDCLSMIASETAKEDDFEKLTFRVCLENEENIEVVGEDIKISNEIFNYDDILRAMASKKADLVCEREAYYAHLLELDVVIKKLSDDMKKYSAMK